VRLKPYSIKLLTFNYPIVVSRNHSNASVSLRTEFVPRHIGATPALELLARATPCRLTTMASPSTTQDRAGKAATAAVIFGKRLVKS
jgi:hypothetical protein